MGRPFRQGVEVQIDSMVLVTRLRLDERIVDDKWTNPERAPRRFCGFLWMRGGGLNPPKAAKNPSKIKKPRSIGGPMGPLDVAPTMQIC
jgi:hypothetical protein